MHLRSDPFPTCSLPPCAERELLSQVHSLQDPHDYGRCRLWGAVGWGLCNAFVLGPMLDAQGAWVMVPLFTVFSAVLLAIVFLLLKPPQAAADVPAENDAPVPTAEKVAAPGQGNVAKVGGGTYAQFDDEGEGARRPRGRGLAAGLGQACGFVWTMLSADGVCSATFFAALYLLSIGTALVEQLVFLFFVQVPAPPRPAPPRPAPNRDDPRCPAPSHGGRLRQLTDTAHGVST
jgi:hypothetical protein